MMTALPVSLRLPLSLAACLTLVFCLIPLLFRLHSVSSAPSFHSSFDVSCLHKLSCVPRRWRLEDPSQPSLIGKPPTPSLCLSPCFSGNHDSCTLDRRQKWKTARGIKAENIADTCTFLYSIFLHLFLTQAFSSHSHMRTWGSVLSQQANKFIYEYIFYIHSHHVEYYTTLSPFWHYRWLTEVVGEM